jgi:hypothetical protein
VKRAVAVSELFKDVQLMGDCERFCYHSKAKDTAKVLAIGARS